jgi:hypothetical protein
MMWTGLLGHGYRAGHPLGSTDKWHKRFLGAETPRGHHMRMEDALKRTVETMFKLSFPPQDTIL